MNLLRRINFNLWYFARPPWDSGISPPELFDFIANHPAGRAIDIGCGTGTNVITLAQHGWQVSGIDFAPRAIQIAKRKTLRLRSGQAPNANVKADLRVGDATKLDGITGPFDLALDMGCFHGVENRSAYLATLDRVLASGGHWLMYGFFKSDPHQSGRFDKLSASSGLAASDLDLIQAQGFRLLSRKDGWDKRQRASAWFLYQKP